MVRAPAVYIMTNKRNGTLYTGVTADLARRCWEHREGVYPGFTKRYELKRLVWYERHELMTAAIAREKQIKAWKQIWKIELIEEVNPTWHDLYEQLNQ